MYSKVYHEKNFKIQNRIKNFKSISKLYSLNILLSMKNGKIVHSVCTVSCFFKLIFFHFFIIIKKNWHSDWNFSLFIVCVVPCLVYVWFVCFLFLSLALHISYIVSYYISDMQSNLHDDCVCRIVQQLSVFFLVDLSFLFRFLF